MSNENTFEKVEISTSVFVQTLDAMYWNFSPYLDYINDPQNPIHEYPWIVALINSYNELVDCLSFEERCEHKIIEF